MCKIVFHSVLNFTHIHTANFSLSQSHCCRIMGHRLLVERRPWAADFTHPKILALRPLWRQIKQHSAILSQFTVTVTPLRLQQLSPPRWTGVRCWSSATSLTYICLLTDACGIIHQSTRTDCHLADFRIFANSWSHKVYLQHGCTVLRTAQWRLHPNALQ